MKRLFLILLLLTFTLTAFSQEERIIKRVELQSGISLSGYVTTQSDGTVMIETADGDVFVYSPSEIRRIVNQDNSTHSDKVNHKGTTIYKQGRFLKYSDTGEPLRVDDFNSNMLWEKYVYAQKLVHDTGGKFLGWGIALGAIGGATIPITSKYLYEEREKAYTRYTYTDEFGYTGYVTEYNESGTQVPLWNTLRNISILASTVGGAMLVTGIICKIAGNSQIAKIADNYNRTPGYACTIDFGAQQYGIGLAMKF